MAATRHQSFIASHIFAGLLALVAFPVYLASVGQPTVLSAIAFTWLTMPILISVFLSKTGRLDMAHLLSAANLAGIVTFAAVLNGGAAPFLMAWMIVVPLMAALSGDRRIVASAFCIAAIAILGIVLCGYLQILPAPQTLDYAPQLLAGFGSISALAYSGGLAVSTQRVYELSECEILLGEERYRLLAENSTDMITRHDTRGHVLFASMASKQILGESADSLSGNGLLQRVHVADRPAYLTAFQRCLDANQPISVEFRLKTYRSCAESEIGTVGYRWVEMRCRPVAVSNGTEWAFAPGEIVAVTRDITERKAQEDALLKACDTAEAANHAKTHFLANMSHELRTPLNAIIGFSEILDRELYGRIGEDRYREYAHLIHQSGEHLLSVVNEILDMSKIEAGKFEIVTEHFDVQGLVATCCEMMRHQGESKSIELKTTVEPQLPELVADKKACKQILLNLLANAIKFTGEGGSVEVVARRHGELIEIAITDTGIGIATEDISKLGNPFVQVASSYDRRFEGTGLGLSLVKGLVQLHGGTLDIQSTLGVGTTISIRLPIDGTTSVNAPVVISRSQDELQARVAMAVGA